MTAMSTEAPTDATKELRASVSMGVPRHTLWATPTVAIHAAFTGLHVTQQDTVLDIGCGDGTTLIEAGQSLGYFTPAQFKEWVKPEEMVGPKK